MKANEEQAEGLSYSEFKVGLRALKKLRADSRIKGLRFISTPRKGPSPFNARKQGEKQ